jgi:hypothetical protein
MVKPSELINKLFSCPSGLAGWKAFEDVCLEILRYLFIPPLSEPKIQARSYSGIDRRDAVFPNRNFDAETTGIYFCKNSMPEWYSLNSKTTM